MAASSPKKSKERFNVRAGVEWYEIRRTMRTHNDEPVRAWECWHVLDAGTQEAFTGWYRTKAEAVEETRAVVEITKGAYREMQPRGGAS